VVLATQTPRLLARGVSLSRLKPGGKDGPDGEVLNSDEPFGGTWSEYYTVGGEDQPFRLAIPDIRMPRNQYWPLHWHDCWIVVVVLDGSALLCDWWMKPGDVLVSPAKEEYGPVVSGPKGVQLIEVFAQDIGALGGYAPECHDHPVVNTLYRANGMAAPILPRPKGSEGHAGNQVTPLATLPNVRTGHLQGGQRWDLGAPDDPERGVMLDTKLAAGEVVPPHRHRDWRGLMIWDGSMRIGDHELTKDDVVIVEPDAEVPAYQAGPQGVHMMEFCRTAAAEPLVF